MKDGAIAEVGECSKREVALHRPSGKTAKAVASGGLVAHGSAGRRFGPGAFRRGSAYAESDIACDTRSGMSLLILLNA
jgi:hypothetical protein